MILPIIGISYRQTRSESHTRELLPGVTNVDVFINLDHG